MVSNSWERLSGGNLTRVYRQNETVLREQKAWSLTIQRLLLHLEKTGCTNTPRFIGIDNSGMEILSFVHGECKEDYPFTNDKNEQLLIIKKVAEIMRKYHDATLAFVRTEKDSWMFSYKGSLEKEVICHNDIAPYNVTFVEGIPYGIIDFDTCCPAPRIWDIVYALYRFVPFSKSFYDIEKRAYRNYDVDRDKNFRKESIRVFFDAYGIECPDYSVSDYPRNFEMVLLIGGHAWREKKSNDIKPVVEYAVQHHIPVAAICKPPILWQRTDI